MTVIITGASSGLGLAIAKQIPSYMQPIIDWSLTSGVDIRDGASVSAAANAVDRDVDCLIHCAGINLIDYLPNVTLNDWDNVLNTNARAIFLVTQTLLPRLRNGTILNIISNASHLPMTASIAYNASKGAAEIMTRQMARELRPTHNITVFGISPNKLSGTGMSNYIDHRVQEVRGWTAEKARQYQLAGLLAGEETNPTTLAEFITFLLSTKQRHKYLHGCVIPYGGP